MVNETNNNNLNKLRDYEHLNERLSASSQHMQEMQEEHHNLLQEMETLRQRATMLTRLETSSFQSSRVSTALGDAPPVISETSSSSATSEIIKDDVPSENVTKESAPNLANVAEDDDIEEAEFIRNKLEEIAGLKAQLKRVQHMTNTTKLIEQHISSHATSTSTSSSTSSVQESLKSSSSTSSSSSSAQQHINEAISGRSTNVSDAKAELLSTMTNMFTDYATDLRGQADSLREERERIRALKEKIIESRRKI